MHIINYIFLADNSTAISTNCFQNLIQHVQATRQKTMRR